MVQGRLTALEKGVIFLNTRTPTIPLQGVIPESINRPALNHNDYGSRCVDEKLEYHKGLEEPSLLDILLDNLDQE